MVGGAKVKRKEGNGGKTKSKVRILEDRNLVDSRGE